MIKALPKFSKSLPTPAIVIDTTSNSGTWSSLSPFILPGPPAKNFENLWQFSKVYRRHLDSNGDPSEEWYHWRQDGFNNFKAVRYPMGKGAIPEYSFWNGNKLGYIEARKRIYAPEYAKNVRDTESYWELLRLHRSGQDIVLLDYDAYDHQSFRMTLKDVINYPRRKMGHAFVLIMMLTGVLDECIANKEKG